MITACWEIKLSVTRSAIHSRTTKNCRWAHLAKGEQIRCAVLNALILLVYNVRYVCKYLTDWMTLFIQVADIRRQHIWLTNRNAFKYCNGARTYFSLCRLVYRQLKVIVRSYSLCEYDPTSAGRRTEEGPAGGYFGRRKSPLPCGSSGYHSLNFFEIKTPVGAFWRIQE